LETDSDAPEAEPPAEEVPMSDDEAGTPG